MQSIQKLLDHYEKMIKELRLLSDSEFPRESRNNNFPDYVRLMTRLNSYIEFKNKLEDILTAEKEAIKPNDLIKHNHKLSLAPWDNGFVKCLDSFFNQIGHDDLVSICREFESVVFTGEDGQLYLINPSGKKVRVSSYYSSDLAVILREASKISNRPKVVIPILPAEIEPVSDFLWVNQFGKEDEKDRRGRWAIQCLYNGTLIATIIREEHIAYGRFYRTKDFFTTLKENNPCRDVYQEKEKDIQKIIAAVEERFKSFINPK